MLGSQSSNLGFRVLSLSNNERPVAYLVSRKPADSHIALPVGPVVTLVGRAALANYVVERSMLAGVIEGVQWRVTWSPGKVSICDAGSTNGSVLVRRADREQVADTLHELQKDPRALRLGWDGAQTNDATQVVADGDVLVNAYGQFLYCSGDDATDALGR